MCRDVCDLRLELLIQDIRWWCSESIKCCVKRFKLWCNWYLNCDTPSQKCHSCKICICIGVVLDYSWFHTVLVCFSFSNYLPWNFGLTGTLLTYIREIVIQIYRNQSRYWSIWRLLSDSMNAVMKKWLSISINWTMCKFYCYQRINQTLIIRELSVISILENLFPV